MSEPETLYDLNWTSRQQARASDPRASAWVAANAGSGKTHVLAERVIRLLLAGARPSGILCLTYTKAAAAEMSNRVFSRLSKWTSLSDEALATELHKLEGQMPDAIKLGAARRLFARALETPGGLKIQTIHAFCEALLHQFPLEANVAAHFEVMDDGESATLLAEARRSLLSATTIETEEHLAAGFQRILEAVGEFGLDELLDSLIRQRTLVGRFHDAARAGAGIDTELYRRTGIDPHETEEAIAGHAWPLEAFPAHLLDLFDSVARSGKAASPKKFVENLKSAALQAPTERYAALVQCFLTKDGSPRSTRNIASADITAAIPDIEERLASAAAQVLAVKDRLALWRMLELTKAAHVLAARLLSDYDRLKRQRGRLDFDDLVERATALLSEKGASAWVHYKLDQGIDHILVDEAQDTSPRQWAIVGRLAEEFFAGEEQQRVPRTLFAVGDEKQSIYSFQGARPERFREEGRHAASRATASARQFETVALRQSFRSTADVLDAVDAVFAEADHKRGLGADDELIKHSTARGGDIGRVDLWEMIGKEKRLDDEDWTAPFDDTPESDPKAQLARRVAGTIRQWVGRETIMTKKGRRPIAAGDILVLVRKRDGFVNALSRELKKSPTVPIAGADRLKLADHIAVKDLVALGRAIVLPDDDLALAAALKSPLFGLSEDDLFALCHGRPGNRGVFDALREHADRQVSPFDRAFARLEHWRQTARDLSVHDFYAELLGPGGVRADFLARLGHEAADLLDEFLSFALDHERTGLPGLEAFLAVLQAQSPEIKREMEQGRDEVRVMTVHASKGLEAPIVFLVDSGGAAVQATHVPKLREMVGEGPEPILWVPGKDYENSVTRAIRQSLEASAEEEYRRLLYVGLTRAADRLVVCGYHGINAPSGAHWHSMVASALSKSEKARQIEFSAGDQQWAGLSFGGELEPVTHKDAEQSSASDALRDLPLVLQRPLPLPARPPRPLVPSGASAIIDGASEGGSVRSPLFDRSDSAGKGAAEGLERGRMMHRMLQMLPAIEAEDREAAAYRYIERAAPHLDEEAASGLAAEALSILDDPQFAEVFAPGSRAEVSVMGTMRLSGRDHVVSGRLDRMVVLPDRVLIVDYKTNRPAIERLEDVSFAHRAQMALYRDLIAPLYPGRHISAALVYTQAPSIIALPNSVLEAAIAELTTK
ncbi:double-strand break repair helicase AddA [Georhizobium profundi]|uniref:DNA 3'-5' helicase n=1 Tax=Georhizobium profundi TaxID=2341112 RepID=A0A3Q8XLA1_9HYPH|nr:double-strand break repair helicase AddA [Georhizobium profundi]AZN70286.1 double-strand break repair helicase AddA [Georhizobium profundi]